MTATQAGCLTLAGLLDVLSMWRRAGVIRREHAGPGSGTLAPVSISFMTGLSVVT